MKYFYCFLILTLGSLQMSCGNNELVQASATTVTKDSDLAKWTGTPCGATSTFSIAPDDISVQIRTIAQPSVNNLPSTVVLDKVTLLYTPADATSLSLEGFYQKEQTLGSQQIVAGTTATVSVTVDQKLKGSQVLSNLVCTNPTIYSYYLVMTFSGHYSPSGESFSTTTSANLRFADFTD